MSHVLVEDTGYLIKTTRLDEKITKGEEPNPPYPRHSKGDRFVGKHNPKGTEGPHGDDPLTDPSQHSKWKEDRLRMMYKSALMHLKRDTEEFKKNPKLKTVWKKEAANLAYELSRRGLKA